MVTWRGFFVGEVVLGDMASGKLGAVQLFDGCLIQSVDLAYSVAGGKGTNARKLIISGGGTMDYKAEAIKLFTQGAVAMLVARLTVSWALGRYKNEKRWERQTEAFVDTIASLSEMRRVVSIWYDEVMEYDALQNNGESSPAQTEREAENLALYLRSKRRLEETSANARLLFDAPLIGLLDQLDVKLNESHQHLEELEALHLEKIALDNSIDRLITAGRNHMGTSS